MTNEPSGKTLVQQKMIKDINDPDQATKLRWVIAVSDPSSIDEVYGETNNVQATSGFVAVGAVGQGVAFESQATGDNLILNDPSPEFIAPHAETATTGENQRVWTVLEPPAPLPTNLRK